MNISIDSTVGRMDLRVRRIAAEPGKVLNLTGVREVVWDDVNGLTIHFAPGGSFRAVRWLTPTEDRP